MFDMSEFWKMVLGIYQEFLLNFERWVERWGVDQLETEEHPTGFGASNSL